MSASIQAQLQPDLLYDSAIVEHHFTPYLRDYDVIIDKPAARPDRPGSYIKGRYRYRFTHVPLVRVNTAVAASSWRNSWDDVFTDYDSWLKAGAPKGFVWGVCWADAYPGLRYVEDSFLAREWSEQFGQTMHEVRIETNAYHLTIVFHDVSVEQIAAGSPDSEGLRYLHE